MSVSAERAAATSSSVLERRTKAKASAAPESAATTAMSATGARHAPGRASCVRAGAPHSTHQS
ncbi:MAG: hypothetical protein E6G41_15990 [Actinobacteria bacterium]|nr:MAG: hypothetical protein E6G41_15990 [Actinomycetota bacterium]